MVAKFSEGVEKFSGRFESYFLWGKGLTFFQEGLRF